MQEKLLEAVKAKDLEEVEKLLTAKAEVTPSILTVAIHVQHIKIIKLLISHSADVNEPYEQGGDTPLMRAAWKGLDTVVRFLIEKGALVNAKNKYGQTALLLAAMEGKVKAAKVLLENGADPTVSVSIEKGDFTALRYAKHYNFTSLIELLEPYQSVGKNIESTSKALKEYIEKISRRSDIEVHSIDIKPPVTEAVLKEYEGEMPTELLQFYAVMNGCHFSASFTNDRNLEIGINIPAIEYLHAFRPANQTNLFMEEKFMALEFEWIEGNYSPFYYILPEGETDLDKARIMRVEKFPESHLVKAADTLEDWMAQALAAGLTLGWAVQSDGFQQSVAVVKKRLGTEPGEKINKQFKDLNFKISVISALHELGYYCEEAERIQNENADWDHSHKPIPAVLEFYAHLEIEQSYLDEIEALQPDGGDLCYQYLLNEWDGEDNQFDITSIDGIEFLTNLKLFAPISMITEDGLDYSPLLLCRKLEKAAPEFIDKDGHGVLRKLQEKGVDVTNRHSNQSNEVDTPEPIAFDPDTPKIIVFYLSEFEQTFGKLDSNISKAVWDSPFYIYDKSLKAIGPEFPDEKDISDEDCTVGFDILKQIWVNHVAQSSSSSFASLFKKNPNPDKDTYFVEPTYGFAPGYDLDAAMETVTQQNFTVVRWEEFWKNDENFTKEYHKRLREAAWQEAMDNNPGDYYAHAIDIDGNEIEIPVNEEGTVQISSTYKIKSLQTNALKVFCRNNELEILEAPNALSVGCNKNKLRSLWLEKAENVHCSENKLTELHAPKATHVRCAYNQLTQLNLDAVVELECAGNKELVSLHAPNLRKIDCDIPKPNSDESFTSIQEIEIELKNRFDPDDISSYDIDTLEVEVILDLHKQLPVEDMSFLVSLQEVNFFSYEKESDMNPFSIYLIGLKNEYGQNEKILEQAPKLPMTLNQRTKLDFSIPIVSYPDQHQNLLDVIKQAPDWILNDEKELVLHITFYLNTDQANEKYDYRMFPIKNPFYKS